MKRFISISLVIVLLSAIFLIYSNAFAFEQETDIPLTQLGESDTYYSFDAASKTLTISGNGDMPGFSNVSSGSTAQPWFKWRSDGSIEHVVVEEGVTSLGKYAFYYIDTKSISLPSTLKFIDSYAMSGLGGVGEIVLPEGLEKLNSYSFYYTTDLERVVIPSTLTTMSISCFEKCSSLSSVEFSDMSMNVSIGRKCFLGCSSLKSVAFPKGATPAAYSYGYSKASAGSVYSDVLMRVYRDSASYDYAVSNLIDFELISDMELFQGKTISRTYYSDNVDDSMVFTFTPSVSATYDFYSKGSVDVDCVLENSKGKELAAASDNSNMDLNFTLSHYLEAGERYLYIVKSVRSVGDFTVSFYPHTVNGITPCFSVELSAEYGNPAYYDIPSKIEGKEIIISFDTGYSEKIEFSKDSKFSVFTVSYIDDQKNTPFKCGNNYGSIMVGNYSSQLTVVINHSYEKTVVEPTFENPGYTHYKCIGCSNGFYTEYKKRLGVRITGRVVLAQSPNASHIDNYPIAYANISADGLNAYTDKDGNFEVYVNPDVMSISFSTPYSIDRKSVVNAGEFNEADLGDIALVNFDIYKDGYINAKDYAQIKTKYGAYQSSDKALYQLDYNRDGVIDDSDYLGAGAYPWGKITESIYN